MSTDSIIVLSAFIVYLLMMIIVGIVSMKKTNSTEDYFLGGRGLNSWVAALSAQASDMSGIHLCAWDRAGLGCHRIIFRNRGKLAIDLEASPQIYDRCEQFAHVAGVFGKPFSR